MSAEKPAQPIIGEAPAFLEMLEHVSRAAPLNKPLLVVGERGTGKELISSRLHFLSRRWEQPLVKVNCAALTESILESELFGHEAGAFTGAIKAHIGHFERADGGTLVLDELATISLRMQEKILRVIEYGELQRVGGSKTISVDVRIAGSTNADLEALAADGKFREDLLDRPSMSSRYRRCAKGWRTYCRSHMLSPSTWQANLNCRCFPGSVPGPHRPCCVMTGLATFANSRMLSRDLSTVFLTSPDRFPRSLSTLLTPRTA